MATGIALGGAATATAVGLWVGRAAVVSWFARLGAFAAFRLRARGISDHPVRVAVIDHLERHPGATARELAAAAGIPYNRIVYHLAMLERADRIRVRKRQRRKHFFCVDQPRVVDDELEMRALVAPETPTGRMLAFLRRNAGASLSRMGRELGFSPGHTHYHLKRLERAGLISRTKQGRATRHYITSRGRQWVARVFPHWAKPVLPQPAPGQNGGST